MCPGAWVIAKGTPRGHDRRLRRHPAGPEDRDLARAGSRPGRRSPAGRGRRCRAPRARRHAPARRAPPDSGPEIVTASATRSAGIGRIETTSGPASRPAGRQGRLVRYIGTLQPCAMWRISIPACSERRLEGEGAADQEGDEIGMLGPGRASRRRSPRPARRRARRGSAAGRGAGRRRGRARSRSCPARSRRAPGRAWGCAARRAGSPRPSPSAGRSGCTG